MIDESTSHLQDAEAWSNELGVEQALMNVPNNEVDLQAHQGHAMRLVVYHGFAAIVAAIKESKS